MECDNKLYVKLNNPIWMGKKQDHLYSVGVRCGKCKPCRDHKISSYSFRLEQELKRCVSAKFVTLTYATHEVPISDNGFMTLKKSHVQDFMKRLRQNKKRRKHISREEFNYARATKMKDIDVRNMKVRYFACGEYGSQRKRPHYHLILFNVSDEDIVKSWDKGEVHIDHVNGAAILYVLKYMSKPHITKFPQYDVLKEFQLCSKDLGSEFLSDKMKDWYRKNPDHNYLINQGAFKVAIPRYYADKIWNTPDLKKERLAVISTEVERMETEAMNEALRLTVNYDKLQQLKKYHRYQLLQTVNYRVKD